MAENIFLKKLENKTDAELTIMVNEKDKFVELARIAAIQILKERNESTDITLKAEQEIEAEKKKEIEARQKIAVAKKKKAEEEKKKIYVTEDPNAPMLHSKRVITIFSVLFSTIFGAALMMQNFKEVGAEKTRFLVLTFGILFTITIIALSNLLNSMMNYAYLLNFIGALILTEYFWNQYIGMETKYRKRNWVKPFIISVIITIPILMLLIFG